LVFELEALRRAGHDRCISLRGRAGCRLAGESRPPGLLGEGRLTSYARACTRIAADPDIRSCALLLGLQWAAVSRIEGLVAGSARDVVRTGLFRLSDARGSADWNPC
jgi:hypothetical protein